MKTAMQQLLERIEATINNDPINDLGIGQSMALKLMKSRIKNEWLEAEKEQIWMAFTDGKVSSIVKNQRTPEEYYNLTYKSEE